MVVFHSLIRTGYFIFKPCFFIRSFVPIAYYLKPITVFGLFSSYLSFYSGFEMIHHPLEAGQ